MPDAGAAAQALAASSAAASRPVTFTDDVADIVFQNCTSCHRPGESAPFPLLSYADVRPRGRQIVNVVRSRQMPPWKADHGDYAFAGDRRLREADIATIENWVAAGMPQGDPAKLPALPTFTSGWQLGEPNLVVKMPEAFPVPATGRDIYRNFVLPLNLDHDVWVKGVDFRPSARAVTHHALFFLDATGRAREQDARDPVPGYDGGMGGGVGLRPAQGQGGGGLALGRESSAGATLGGWAPGAQARLLPDDLAFFVPKGSDLIVSTHFHPSGTAAAEASTIGIYFADAAPSKAFTGIQLPPMFGVLAGINIPAGSRDYTISDSFVIPIAVRGFGVGGHAHYLAKTMMMTATLPSGEKKTLLDVRDWDFSWQEQYLFTNYVDLPAGTKLDVTVGYDNSTANKRNPSTPPQVVHWGEESTDEMGSMTLRVIAANPNELPTLHQAIGEHLREKAKSATWLGTLFRGSGANR